MMLRYQVVDDRSVSFACYRSSVRQDSQVAVPQIISDKFNCEIQQVANRMQETSEALLQNEDSSPEQPKKLDTRAGQSRLSQCSLSSGEAEDDVRAIPEEYEGDKRWA